MIRASGQSKSIGLLKRRVRSHVVRGEIKNCTPLWRKAHFEVKMYKTPHGRSTFCRKIARRCGEKQILKSKCTKHPILGALFEVLMSKNCTPLWREVHSQVKMLKNWRSRSVFWSSDVEKLHAPVARSTCPSQNVKKLTRSEHFWSSDV